LADCFQFFGTGGERLLPAKLKVSFRLIVEFYAASSNDGNVFFAVIAIATVFHIPAF
jgi:hypothetical protein